MLSFSLRGRLLLPRKGSGRGKRDFLPCSLESRMILDYQYRRGHAVA
jgi:hypothetical protein